MKKLLFFALLTSCLLQSKELAIMPVENNEVIYQAVVELGEQYSAITIFEAADLWLKKSVNLRKMGGEQSAFMMFNGQSVKPIMASLESDMRSREKLLTKEDGKEISYQFLQYYQAKKGAAIRTLLLDSELSLQFKDGKYRYQITDFNYQHYNHFTGSQNRIYAIGKKCGANGSLFQLQSICNKANNNRIKALTAIDENTQEFIEHMLAGILAGLETDTSNDDW